MDWMRLVHVVVAVIAVMVPVVLWIIADRRRMAERVTKIDHAVFGPTGTNGLVGDMKLVKVELGTVDNRITRDGRHAAMNAISPIIHDMEARVERDHEKLDARVHRLETTR